VGHDLDFVELERKTVELLHNSEPASRRIKAQYRAVLIDESQDMNPIQHRLVEALGIEQEMLVGDAQQSIYGFRQADVRIFEEKAGQKKTLPLSSNKRSEQGVLRFVDELFGKVWQSYLPMAQSFEGAETRFRGVEMWVQKVKDTAQVASWLKELVGEEGAKKVAVLTRTSGYAQDLLSRLETLKVPARIAGGSERYYTRLEIRDLANCLTALVDPHEDFALLAALHSPLANLSLDSIVLLAQGKAVWKALPEFDSPVPEDKPKIERFLGWFEPLTKFADRLSAWEVLSEILAKSPYFETVAKKPAGIQTLANVRKLLSIAAGMPESDARVFAKRMREIREIRHHEGDAPALEDEANQVTIMTIHKAKGLEFDCVVIPETLAPERRMGDLEIDRSTGMLTVSFGGGGSSYHLINTQWRKERDREELYRLLYVALTRAKRRLCLVVDPSAPPSKLAGDVVEKLGWREGFPDEIKIREASTAPPVEAFKDNSWGQTIASTDGAVEAS
jgi:ATP-dependent exoDNAse (exonuclease V) beta subunit